MPLWWSAPPELVNKILFEIGNNTKHEIVKPPFWQRFMGRGVRSILAASFRDGHGDDHAVVRNAAAHGRRSRNGPDLDPANLFAAAEDRVVRVWDRGMKHYQSLKLVFVADSDWCRASSTFAGRNWCVAVATNCLFRCCANKYHPQLSVTRENEP